MFAKKILLVILLILALPIVWLFSVYNIQRPKWNIPESQLLKIQNSTMVNSKWIVVSTSRPPSDSIKYLASIPGWKVVAVGDEKTPPSWKLSNCIFLSVSRQNNLPFKVLKFLPSMSQSRKIIGYLFAIYNGATAIYETEESYQLEDQLNIFNLQNEITSLRYDGKKVFNSYRHFGQPYLRPNGFPLDTYVEEGENKYNLAVSKTPLIQQGQVQGDPDINIIFRLAAKPSQVSITFTKQAPPVIIPKGVFAPFNSKNTLFLYDAIWAMVIPLKSSISDILRGYWAQRLLWEIGGTVGFYPPNSSYKQSIQTAQDNLYFKYSILISFLSKWQCTLNLRFFQCVRKLSNDMVTYSFWDNTDYQLITAWLDDLKSLGYKEPIRISFNNPEAHVNLAPVFYQSQESENTHLKSKSLSRWKQISDITTYCSDTVYQLTSTSLKPVSFPDILLIIGFNHPRYDVIPYLQLLYSVRFNFIVYCGNNMGSFLNISRTFSKNVTFIEEDVQSGYYIYRCISAAMKMNYRVDGYLFISDDVLLNSWNVENLPRNEIWFSNFINVYRDKSHPWHWWQQQVGRPSFNKAWQEIVNIKMKKPILASLVNKFVKTLKDNSGSDQGAFHYPSDIVYIPHIYKEEAILFMDIFSRHNVFLEVAIPSIIAGLSNITTMVALKGQYLWYDGKRGKVPQLFKKDEVFIHPVKLSGFKTGYKNFFCRTYFPLMLTGTRNTVIGTKSTVPHIRGSIPEAGPL